MKKEDIELVEQMLEKVNVGYAYFYPSSGEPRKEYMFDMTPENIANFLGSHQFDAEKIILTDMCDRLILDTFGGFINHCPDQSLNAQIVSKLAPIQMGDKEVEEFLIMERDVMDDYCAFEDEMVTRAEISMM